MLNRSTVIEMRGAKPLEVWKMTINEFVKKSLSLLNSTDYSRKEYISLFCVDGSSKIPELSCMLGKDHGKLVFPKKFHVEEDILSSSLKYHLLQFNDTGLDTGDSPEILKEIKSGLIQDFQYVKSILDVMERRPSRTKKQPIVKILAGKFSSHGFILSPKGDFYCFGWNRHGQLGIELETKEAVWGFSKRDGKGDFLRVPFLHPFCAGMKGSSKIVKIHSGRTHTAYLSRNGVVYTSGLNDRGQQVQPGCDRKTFFPTQIDFATTKGNRIVDIHCGFSNTFVILKNREIWAAGYNTSGQLGDGGSSDRYSLTLTKFKNIKVLQAGDVHTLGLTFDGWVYGTGSNWKNKMGLRTDNSNIPVKVPFSENGNVAQINGGYFYSLFLTSSGSVYCVGENDNGCLGLSHTNQISNPQKNPFLENVVGMACGWNFSFFSTADNVYSCGTGKSGGLGNLKSGNFAKLQLLDRVVGRVREVVCTGNNVYLLEHDRILAAGNNDRGQMFTEGDSCMREKNHLRVVGQEFMKLMKQECRNNSERLSFMYERYPILRCVFLRIV